MKNIDSFPKLLNDFFSELSEASNIVIHYRVLAPSPVDDENPVCAIVSVNGHSSLFNYSGAMEDLKANVLCRIVETELPLAPKTQLRFLRQAMSRCKKLLSVVAQRWAICESVESSPEDVIPCWVFKDPACTNTNGSDTTPDTTETILLLTSHHATCWQQMVREIQHELKCYYDLVEVTPGLLASEKTDQPEGMKNLKLLVRGNVPGTS
jgi:hypothetical protein